MSSVFRIDPTKPKQSNAHTESRTSSRAIFNVGKKKEEDSSEEMFEDYEESKGEWLLRNASRLGSDVLQEIAGAPGNALQLLESVSAPLSDLLGEERVSYEDSIVGKILPTSRKLQEGNSERLKPRTHGEEKASEFTRDLTSLLIPLPGKKGQIVLKGLDWLKSTSKRLMKSAGLVTAGIGAEELAEQMGVDPETAKNIKMATVMLGSLGTESGFNGAEKYKNSLYSNMRQLRPSGAYVNGNQILQKARKLKIKLEKGGKSPSSTKALEKTEELINKIRKGRGRISVEELEQFGIKTNELKSGLYDDFKGNKVGRKSAKANLNEFSDVVESGIEEYGKTNPKYHEARKAAQEAHGAIESSKKASRFLKRNIKQISTGGAGTVLIEAVTNPAAILPTAGGALASFAGLKGAELISRIVKSPVLRKYYLNVIDGAVRKDVTFMNRNFEYLQKKIEDDPSLLDISDED